MIAIGHFERLYHPLERPKRQRGRENDPTAANQLIRVGG